MDRFDVMQVLTWLSNANDIELAMAGISTGLVVWFALSLLSSK